MERLLWLLPVGALALTAFMQDLQAFSLAVTAIGLLLALRQGRGSAPSTRSMEAILSGLIPHVGALIVGIWVLGRLFPNAAHDAVQAGDKGYAVAIWLGVLAAAALVAAGRWPVQRVAARLLLMAGLTALLLTGIMGSGRWAEALPRVGGTLMLMGLGALMELWLGVEEAEPDLAGLVPAFAGAIGPAALYLEAVHLWQRLQLDGFVNLDWQGRFLLVATLVGWAIWAGLLGLVGIHKRFRSLQPLAGYLCGAMVLYGLCWVLVG